MTVGRSTDLVIRVFSYRQRIMEGTVESETGGDRKHFTEFMALMDIIEKRLGDNNAPQLAMALRGWDLAKLKNNASNSEESPTDFVPEGGLKPLAAFVLSIQFRQNGDWQGRLLWMNQKRSMAFRSFLELATLLDRALLYTTGAEQAIPVDRPAHKWKRQESVS